MHVLTVNTEGRNAQDIENHYCILFAFIGDRKISVNGQEKCKLVSEERRVCYFNESVQIAKGKYEKGGSLLGGELFLKKFFREVWRPMIYCSFVGIASSIISFGTSINENLFKRLYFPWIVCSTSTVSFPSAISNCRVNSKVVG